MKQTQLMTNVTKTFNKVGFQLKKHSPEILVVAGVVGTVASAVMACKATTKVSKILDETKETVDTIHDCLNSPEFADDYTPEDGKKDLAIVYVQTGLKVAKLYAPAVILGALSITSILASNNILRRRNVALAAAYATVDKSFKEYRGRVVERFGEAVDKELKYNIKAKQIEETVVDEKTGKEKKVKKTIEYIDGRELSEFATFFDEASVYWEKDAKYNLMFVRAQQQYANDLLRTKGHLFLNDVYTMLGLPKTRAGNIVGWIYDPNSEKRDGYVDFGILETHKESISDLNRAFERTILLDFNVDGNILDLMDSKEYYHKFTTV